MARAQAAGELNLLGQPRLPAGEEQYIAMFNPGEPLDLELLADVYPELVWNEGYDTIEVTVEREPVEESRIQKALKSLQERYLKKTPASADYAGAVGDIVLADMTGFHVAADGSKGEPLPAIASGDGVEILLEPGQFMPGFVEGLIGAKGGEVKDISVSFPKQATRTLTPELAGQPAIFEVRVKEVMTRDIPDLDDAFADSVRPGLTYDELYKEVRTAVGEEGDRKNMENRNKVCPVGVSLSRLLPHLFLIARPRCHANIPLTFYFSPAGDRRKDPGLGAGGGSRDHDHREGQGEVRDDDVGLPGPGHPRRRDQEDDHQGGI